MVTPPLSFINKCVHISVSSEKVTLFYLKVKLLSSRKKTLILLHVTNKSTNKSVQSHILIRTIVIRSLVGLVATLTACKVLLIQLVPVTKNAG